MADCGQPNAMSLMAGQMLNAQQNVRSDKCGSSEIIV
jgi:hypothetical protein